MNWTLREEIAKERFLDMMANQKDSMTTAIAAFAVAEADALISALKIQYNEQNKNLPNPYFVSTPTKTKGCKACYGSGGGKKNGMCKVCKGSGRVVI